MLNVRRSISQERPQNSTLTAAPKQLSKCNGQGLNDVGSPLNGVTTSNLNGAIGGTQMFLRGAAASGGTGGANSHSLLKLR